MRKVTKLPRYLTVNFIGACEEYCKDTGKKEVRLGDFLSWLKERSGKMPDIFETAEKVKDKKLTPKDIEKAIKEGDCPFCGSPTFNATIEAYRNFYISEKGEIAWWNDIETQGDSADLARNPTITCKTCFREIPKEVWEKWFERS